MPSHAVDARLNVIVVLLAGILGTLAVLVWSTEGVGALVAAIFIGSAFAWLAVERVNDSIERGG